MLGSVAPPGRPLDELKRPLDELKLHISFKTQAGGVCPSPVSPGPGQAAAVEALKAHFADCGAPFSKAMPVGHNVFVAFEEAEACVHAFVNSSSRTWAYNGQVGKVYHFPRRCCLRCAYVPFAVPIVFSVGAVLVTQFSPARADCCVSLLLQHYALVITRAFVSEKQSPSDGYVGNTVDTGHSADRKCRVLYGKVGRVLEHMCVLGIVWVFVCA